MRKNCGANSASQNGTMFFGYSRYVDSFVIEYFWPAFAVSTVANGMQLTELNRPWWGGPMAVVVARRGQRRGGVAFLCAGKGGLALTHPLRFRLIVQVPAQPGVGQRQHPRAELRQPRLTNAGPRRVPAHARTIRLVWVRVFLALPVSLHRTPSMPPECTELN